MARAVTLTLQCRDYVEGSDPAVEYTAKIQRDLQIMFYLRFYLSIAKVVVITSSDFRATSTLRPPDLNIR